MGGRIRMSEWKETTLGNHINFRNGKSSPDRVDGLSFPVYGSNGVIGHANVHNTTHQTIVIGRVGSFCGSLYFSKSKAWVTDNAIIAEAKSNNDPLFFFYILQDLNLNNFKVGSGQPLINQSILSSIKTIVPEYAEQRAVAAVLGALDDKIELNRRMNTTLENMVRALFKSWFVDFDPVRSKMEGRQPFGMDAATAALFSDNFVDSEFGEIPEGWRSGTLGEIANNPRDIVQPNKISSEVPYIGLEHMPRRCIALTEWGQADKVISHKSAFVRGDFLFGKLRPYFHKVGIAAVDGICSTDIAVVRAKSQEFYAFILSVISGDEFVSYTTQLSNGAKMPRINWSDMANYGVVLPPLSIVSAYNAAMDPIIKQIIFNIHENKKLSILRDYLLPKLISGDVRVRAGAEIIDLVAVLKERAERSIIEKGYVDAKELCRQQGVAIVKNQNLSKGRINHDGSNDEFYIEVANTDDSFTIMHELVHHAKHSDRIRECAVGRNDEYSLSKKEEDEVDALAAEILMPEKFVREFLNQKSIQENSLVEDKIIKSCAKQFRVSEPAMHRRINDLGYKTNFKNYQNNKI